MKRLEEIIIEIELIGAAGQLGVAIDVDPDTAEWMGLFRENGLSPEDADRARFKETIELEAVR